jgi:exodeoxyribonuclease III
VGVVYHSQYKKMKISSWNVNSVRARISNVIDYIKVDKPDIIFLQEIKTENINFPLDEFKKLGYESYIFGQKSYNGVAFLSKIKIDNIQIDFIKDDLKQSRIICGDILIKKKKIKIINIYVPNGNPINTDKYKYKINWLNKFLESIKKTLVNEKNIIIAGDFNIIPEEIDVHDHTRYLNDALFKIEIRKFFRELLNYGFKDVYRFLNKNNQEYTFWDYMAGSWQKNYGMRIDHFLASDNLLENIENIEINKKPRSKTKPSDHTPIEIVIT